MDVGAVGGGGGGADNGAVVVESAIEQWLTQALKEIRGRDLQKAMLYLEKARGKLQKLSPKARPRWENRYHDVRLHLTMCDLYPPEPVEPFAFRFRSYSSQTVNPEVYYCFNMITKMLRDDVFVVENAIPAQVEYDDRDANALHSHVLRGDAPYAYSRTWIAQGPNNPDIKWAVLDRLCTIRDASTISETDRSTGARKPGYTFRCKGAATYMLTELVNRLRQDSAQTGTNILVVHMHARASNLKGMIQKLYSKGFRLVLKEEEVRRCLSPRGGDAPLYMDGKNWRINFIMLWFPLVDNKDLVQRDLAEAAAYGRQHLALLESDEQKAMYEKMRADIQENLRKAAETAATST